MSDPLTDAELAAMRAAATDPDTPPWVRGYLCALLAEVERLRDQLRERWPHLTDAELAAMRARCEAATPGDWRYYRSGCPEFRNVVHCVEAGELLVCEANGAGTDNYANAVFIAHARSDIPRLLADLDRLRADNAALRRQVAGHCERIAAQSALLARRAERTPVVTDPDPDPDPDPPLPRGPAGG